MALDPRQNEPASNGATVSVIVPTRNSARTISACLGSIRAQSHDAIELIVVDNHSTDGTPAQAASLADVVSTAGPERCAQRNAGARRAHGRYLFFIDSDMVLAPTVVAECVTEAAAGADAVIVPEVSFGEGFWARCKALERSCYVGDDTVEAARFFSRAAFATAGGYDETFNAGEDWDLHERVRSSGAAVARIEPPIRHDEGRLRLRRLIYKKFQYGRELPSYMAKHPDLARQQLRLIRPAYIRHVRRLARHPILLVGMILMKVAEAGAGALGFASARLMRTASAG